MRDDAGFRNYGQPHAHTLAGEYKWDLLLIQDLCRKDMGHEWKLQFDNYAGHEFHYNEDHSYDIAIVINEAAKSRISVIDKVFHTHTHYFMLGLKVDSKNVW